MTGKLRRMAAGAAVTVLVALGGVASTAVAASAGTVASCSAQGEYATCDASGQVNEPTTIAVSVTSSPDQPVYVSWDTTCAKGLGAGGSSGSFTATTPVTRTIPHPYANPDYCIVAAGAQLQNGGNRITVTILSPAPRPPAVHEIKGYDSKCVDDTGNRLADGTKIELWSCNKTAAQNWSFSNGELAHGGKCANDSGNAGSGGKVVLYKCSSAANDHWTHKSNGEYVLKSHSGKLCLEDPGNSVKNGAQLEVYACKDSSNQRWSLP